MKIKLLLLLLFANANAIFAQDAYIGEIKLFPINFSPRGWAPCNGQMLAIQQNSALFSLLGTTYGGNGTTTFALPDLRGRVVVGEGPDYSLGQTSGAESVVLSTSNTAHSHTIAVKVNTTVASSQTPLNGNSIGVAKMDVNGANIPVLGFNTSVPNILLAQDATSTVGSSQPLSLSVLQPTLGIQYMIAIQGIFPPQN